MLSATAAVALALSLGTCGEGDQRWEIWDIFWPFSRDDLARARDERLAALAEKVDEVVLDRGDCAICVPRSGLPPDLESVVEAWPDLPGATRRAILVIVRLAGGGPSARRDCQKLE